jgi:signal peptidase I
MADQDQVVDQDTESDRPRKRGWRWLEFPILIVAALLLAVLIKTFLVQAFYIPSASMENTLQGGNPTCASCGASSGHPFDRVLVNRLAYDFSSPHRGDIIVFKGPPGWPDEAHYAAPSNPVARVFHDIGSVLGLTPPNDNDFVKRVIGVGGDTISCKKDVLRVNGHVLEEKAYLYPGSNQCSGDGFEGRTVVVPKGQLFVMGDHRDDSADSRVNGPVPVSDVIGRAFAVIWPIKDWKTLSTPATFNQPGLAMSGTSSTVIILVFLLVVVIVVVALAVLWGARRKRRRRAATYPAVDG